MLDELPHLDITRVFYEPVTISMQDGFFHFVVPGYKCRQCGWQFVNGFFTNHPCTAFLN